MEYDGTATKRARGFGIGPSSLLTGTSNKKNARQHGSRYYKHTIVVSWRHFFALTVVVAPRSSSSTTWSTLRLQSTWVRTKATQGPRLAPLRLVSPRSQVGAGIIAGSYVKSDLNYAGVLAFVAMFYMLTYVNTRRLPSLPPSLSLTPHTLPALPLPGKYGPA